jgi:hypothetical protein
MLNYCFNTMNRHNCFAPLDRLSASLTILRPMRHSDGRRPSPPHRKEWKQFDGRQTGRQMEIGLVLDHFPFIGSGKKLPLTTAPNGEAWEEQCIGLGDCG